MRGTKQIFIFFVTACGCCRMERATVGWELKPEFVFPLTFPAAVHDWVNDPTDDSITPASGTRTFRLRDEQTLRGGMARIYTYEEVI